MTRKDEQRVSGAGDGAWVWWHRYGLLLVLVAVGIALAVAKPVFLTPGNLVNVVRQISINGILAVGVTLVLLSGGVDLSLGSVVALAGVVAAWFARSPDAFLLPVMMGVLAGTTCGAMNGWVVTRGGVAPFIVTLGMMTAARGVALLISEGRPVSGLSPAFRALGSGDWLGIPYPVLVLVTVAGAMAVILRNVRWGRHLYAVGGNEHAARASGLDVANIRLAAYTLCGALAGLAGVVLASRLTTGQPNAGVGYELDAIAAVVIGGTSLSGGVGGVGGTILGALLMGVINNGLDLLNVSSYYQAVIKGVIIVGAVWLDKRAAK
ncbi:MAG: ABC transporter permease [Limisphaerales bacterium]